MPSYVVTGSSRGLGLGFVRTLSADPANLVFAVIRSHSSAEQLHDFISGHPHKNVHVIEADCADARALQRAADQVSKITGGTLDVLINNAAVMVHDRSGLSLDAFPSPETLEEDLILYFKTNTIGPIHTTNAFLPLLLSGSTKKCLTISTTAGSPAVASATNFANFAGYGISKAGVNLAMAKYAARFRQEGVVFLTLTPGMVRTMPGTEEEVDSLLMPIANRIKEKYPHFEGPISVEQSVRDALAFLDRATIAESGPFVHRDGRSGDSI